MQKIKKSAFTLVELIVVITILAILWTIAFISLQWYSRDARDATRTSDLWNIKTSLELFSLKTWKYPSPDSFSTITYSGWTENVWYQWVVWDKVTTNLKSLNDKPLDPLTNDPYTYSVTNSYKEYEVLALYEWAVAYNLIINQTNAAVTTLTPKIAWNYNWVFVKTNNYIIPTPSIVIAEPLLTWTPLPLTSSSIKSLVMTNGVNIPKNSLNPAQTWALNINLSVYTWSITKTSSTWAMITAIKQIQQAYTWTTISSQNNISYILNQSTDSQLLALWNLIILKGSKPIVVNNTSSQSSSIPTDIILDKINNVWWTSFDTFSSVIYDWTNYIAVWYSSSNLSWLTWWTNTTWGNDFIIAKYDSNLNLIKLNNIWWTNSDIFSSVIYDWTNYIAVWYSNSNLSWLTWWTNTTWINDFIIAKYDSNLNLIKLNNIWWTNQDFFSSVIYDWINYVSTWYSASDLSWLTWWTNTTWGNDFVVAKYDSNLNLIKLNNIWWTNGDIFESIIYDWTNYIAAWYSISDLSWLTWWTNTTWGYDFAIAKYDSNLNLIKLNNIWWINSDVILWLTYDGVNYITIWYTQSDLSSLTWWTNITWIKDFIISKYDNNLNLVKINNIWLTSTDMFNSVIYDWSNYIGVWLTDSNLSWLTWWTNTTWGYDFVISRFK